MEYRTLIIGIGAMGRNHARKIMSGDLPNMHLEVVCDSDLGALMKFRSENPDVPVALIPHNGEKDQEAIEQARRNGIEVFNTAKDVIDHYDCNTLVNATHNPSHIPVLEDCFSARDEKGVCKIRTVFQEKPFAHTYEEAKQMEGFIKDNDITFNLNGILSFSPIWNDFVQSKNDLEKMGFKLSSVQCTYGKDRTNDNRPAPNGWVGLEAIHALDISTFDMRDVAVKNGSVTALNGFLAQNANMDDDSGVVPFGHQSRFSAITACGNPVSIDIEGSFAWAEQNRRVRYSFEDNSGQKAVLEVEFDRRGEGTPQDVLTRAVYDKNGEVLVAPEEKISGADKLLGYYKAVVDPADQKPLYTIDRAMKVQGALEKMGQPDKTIQIDAMAAPKSPQLFKPLDIRQVKQAPTVKLQHHVS